MSEQQQPAIVNNTQNQHFEMAVDNDIAFIEYRWYHGNLALMHTQVPEAAQGKGVAGALANYAFNYAKENNLKVMVYCPYVAVWLKRHPEYADLVDKKYQQ